MILNKKYLTAIYLTQKSCSHPKNSLPPASRKSHVEESCGSPLVEEWEARVPKKMKETQFGCYLVGWLLLTQCSAFSMIHTTLEQMKGLVLVFYLGCLGGTFYFLESSRKAGLPSSKSKTRNHDLDIRATPNYTIRNQYIAQHPYWHVWSYTLTSCFSQAKAPFQKNTALLRAEYGP